MTTTIKVSRGGTSTHAHPHEKQRYSTKQEIDTTIPPKAKPVFNEVSVNGVVIAESDILREAQNHPAKNPGDALLQAARALVVRELLWQEAKNKGLVPEEDVAGQTQLDAAIANLLDQEVNTPEAREEDCRRLYDRDPSRFSTDTIWEVRHILLAANPEDKKAYEDARIQAEKILSLLKEKPTEFAEIAKNMSACPSAKEGGNLGQITRGSTVPEFEDALKNAHSSGLLAQPVATRYGYHIIDISHIIPGETLPFEMVREKIAAWLEASSWSKAVQQYIAILAGKSHITGVEVKPNEGPLVQ